MKPPIGIAGDNERSTSRTIAGTGRTARKDRRADARFAPTAVPGAWAIIV